MNDDFDDDTLRDALRARSGGPVDHGSGRRAVGARSARVRTRRNALVGGAATAAVVVGLVLLPTPRDNPPATSDTVLPPVSTVVVDETSPSTVPAPTPSTVVTTAPGTTPVVPTVPPTASPDPGTGDGQEAPTSTAPSPAITPAPTTPSSSAAPPSTDAPSTDAPSTVSPPESTPSTSGAPQADAPFTQQYRSIGGSITVRWDGSALSLLGVAPDAGFEPEVEDQSSSRIRVRFRGDDDDARIEVRADDGQVESTVS